MLKKWQKLCTKVLFENNWWVYKCDEFQIPGGVRGEYHYVDSPGSSMIIPYFDDGSILMVNQYRYLYDRESIEFPCGSVKPGSDYLRTAREELTEEGGVRAGKMQYIGEYNPYNGVTNEICQVFLASDLQPASAAADATEEFEIIHCTPAEIDRMIRNNIIWDGMTMAAWILARPFFTD